MEKAKVVSFRLPESLVEKLDEVVRGTIWYKRNAIVVNILQNVIDHADSHTRNLLITNGGWHHTIESIEVKLKEK